MLLTTVLSVLLATVAPQTSAASTATSTAPAVTKPAPATPATPVPTPAPAPNTPAVTEDAAREAATRLTAKLGDYFEFSVDGLKSQPLAWIAGLVVLALIAALVRGFSRPHEVERKPAWHGGIAWLLAGAAVGIGLWAYLSPSAPRLTEESRSDVQTLQAYLTAQSKEIERLQDDLRKNQEALRVTTEAQGRAIALGIQLEAAQKELSVAAARIATLEHGQQELYDALRQEQQRYLSARFNRSVVLAALAVVFVAVILGFVLIQDRQRREHEDRIAREARDEDALDIRISEVTAGKPVALLSIRDRRGSTRHVQVALDEKTVQTVTTLVPKS